VPELPTPPSEPAPPSAPPPQPFPGALHSPDAALRSYLEALHSTPPGQAPPEPPAALQTAAALRSYLAAVHAAPPGQPLPLPPPLPRTPNTALQAYLTALRAAPVPQPPSGEEAGPDEPTRIRPGQPPTRAADPDEPTRIRPGQPPTRPADSEEATRILASAPTPQPVPVPGPAEPPRPPRTAERRDSDAPLPPELRARVRVESRSQPVRKEPRPAPAPVPAPAPATAVAPAPVPPRSRLKRWGIRIGIGAAVIALAGVAALWAVVRHYSTDIPDISWAEHYRPPIVADVLSGDDQLLGEFYAERRRVVPYERIPKKLVQAFIAAEDARFFDHPGIDLAGIVRAAVQNVASGRRKSGASTLTQQTAKAILISTWGFERATAKTFHRKICEAILARRLEQRFSKEEILALYLNQVYLGHSSYGVQAAAENYFRKNAWDLTLPEMSLLAGLPQAPSKYSPFKHPEAARRRRAYVLEQMLQKGMISKEQHDEAAAAEVTVFPVEDFFHETAPYVTEHVRRDLVQRYGNDRLLNDGLKVFATVDLDLEREAAAAMLKGLVTADKRQGYAGPLMKVEAKDKAGLDGAIAGFRKVQREKGAAPVEAEKLGTQTWVGVVLEAAKDQARVGVGDKVEGTLPLELMRWARKPNSEQSAQYVQADAVNRVLAKGDVVLVRAAREDEFKPSGKKAPQGPVLALEVSPKLQGALVSMDPKSGYIVAMIGGYDFNASEFNRAFQACRQPGSSFKPVYYSAALDGQVRVDADPKCRPKSLTDEERRACQAESCRTRSGAWDAESSKCYFTPATMLLDAPIVMDDEVNQVRWKPSNFENQFKGEVTLREALVNSMNIPAVHVLEAVGTREAAAWARRLGITTPVNEDLSIALGSSCVTLWELTHVYAMLSQLGERVPSTFLRRVVDRDGRVLEDHSAWYDPWTGTGARLAAGYAALFQERERVVDAASAYVLAGLMQDVCRYGTGAAAAKLGRTIAGKTGTTNDFFDAWFMGFTPDIVTGTWVGYDTYDTPMTRYDTGGHTALPIWMDYMAAVLKGRPNRSFPMPDGVVRVSMDMRDGKAAAPDSPHSATAAFRSGTQPAEPGEESGETPAPATGGTFLRDDL